MAVVACRGGARIGEEVSEIGADAGTLGGPHGTACVGSGREDVETSDLRFIAGGLGVYVFKSCATRVALRRGLEVGLLELLELTINGGMSFQPSTGSPR